MATAVHQRLAVFGRYELLEYLGGGMADVYRALDTITGKTVAVKILKPQFAADLEMKARFLNEARTAAPLEHPHLADVFDFGEIEGRTYMVMEYLRGDDMRTAIRKGAAGDLLNKLRIMLQVAEAVEYIHSKGIVHRDLKPENIHIDTAGVARLIDFGIAKTETATHKTQVGFAIGTPLYMAPEQLKGNPTKLVDVYSFGIVFYELLTSRKANQGQTDEQICFFILNEKLNLAPLRSSFPGPVLDLISQCAEKDPACRPQDFAEIRQRLQRIIVSLEPVTALLPARTEDPGGAKKRLRLWAYGGIGAAVLFAMIAAVMVSRPKPPKTPAIAPVIRPAPRSKLAPTLSHPAGDMVLVPAGPFLFGKDKTPQTLPDFYIDKTEVTIGAFARFAQARNFPASREHPENPVVNVTVTGARTFCEWAGKRLPSMYEWEKAARGTDGRDFPWGNAVEPWRANVIDNTRLQRHAIMPALSFVDEGASPYGALQMAGNVWEFVEDSRRRTPEEVRAQGGDPAAEWPMIYGGSFKGSLDGSPNAKSWDSAVFPSNARDGALGFRCAKTAANP